MPMGLAPAALGAMGIPGPVDTVDTVGFAGVTRVTGAWIAGGTTEPSGAPMASRSPAAGLGALRDVKCLECRRHPPPWQRVVAGVDYAYPWAELVAAFKFSQRTELARVLCLPLQRRLLAGPCIERLAGLRVVPVPLAHERLRERGYNQAWELARPLARAIGAPAAPDALFRVRETPHQPGLARAQRAANLRDAFVVSPHRAAWLRGAAIALVDDVLTTGATARAAVRAMYAAGAREVEVWVVARTA
jgi:ComF family protein